MAQAVSELRPPGRRSLRDAREILLVLVTKELKVKYKRSVLGFAWSLVTPLALAGVYLFVFVSVYHVPQEDFALFLLTGLFPWHFFSMSLAATTESVINNAPMVRKVSFPRLVMPMSTVSANLVHFLLALALLVPLVAATGRPVWLHLHWLALAVVLETALCLGLGMALAVWNVYFRDIRQAVNIMLPVLFFATPIVYNLSLVPEAIRPFILANPLAGVMEVYRAALFEASAPHAGHAALAALQAAVALALGWVVFRRLAPHLAREV